MFERANDSEAETTKHVVNEDGDEKGEKPVPEMLSLE